MKSSKLFKNSVVNFIKIHKQDIEQRDAKGICLIIITLAGTTVIVLIGLAILLIVTLKLQRFPCNSASVHVNNKNITFQETEKVVSCYFNTPAVQDMPQLMPSSINPYLCTHINVAFAQVKDKKIYLKESQWQTILEVVKLKKINTKLKILLSVGGAGNNDGFADMVVDHASRKEFIRSIKYVLRNHSLDGIDLDWEFPGIQDQYTSIGKRQRQHFSQLLREIRMEYFREKRDYLLTVAVAAQKEIVDFAYDVDQLNLYVDYVNLMTYDFHFFTKFTPFTGLNSPLYPKPTENLYMGTLNINYTVQMYLSKGLNESKIVMGIPTYGHSFKLVNSGNTNIGSPAKSFGELGALGFINYPDICLFVSKWENDVTIKTDGDALVPYLYKDAEWVSYDNPQSVIEKASFIKAHNLRGAMIYSLNADDYEGVCTDLSGTGKFPLTISIKNALHEDRLEN